MLRDAKVSVPVTVAQLSHFETMIGNIKNSMTNLVNLTPDDKASLLKVGNAQLGMIEQVRRVCVAHPDVMPRYHDIADYYARIDTMDRLLTMQALSQSLLESIESTLSGAKHDAMVITLDYYRSLKSAQASSMPGLHRFYMDIRENFMHDTGEAPEEQFPEVDPNAAKTTETGTPPPTA